MPKMSPLPHLTAAQIEKFAKQIDIPEDEDDCWLWRRGRQNKGYGVVEIHGQRYAHRVAYVVLGGHDDPEDMFVLHRCDVPHCCNPSHLFLGTHIDNMDDMNRKGRGARGQGRPKLTVNQVQEIRQRLRDGCPNDESLAREFKVSWAAILYIRQGRTWKDVP